MAVTSVYTVQINLSQDIKLSQEFIAVANTLARGDILTATLAPGDNTIFSGALTSGGFVIRGILFIPPVSNTHAIILKGNAGDTGISLSTNTPTMLSVNAAASPTLILNAASTIQQFRYIRL